MFSNSHWKLLIDLAVYLVILKMNNGFFLQSPTSLHTRQVWDPTVKPQLTFRRGKPAQEQGGRIISEFEQAPARSVCYQELWAVMAGQALFSQTLFVDGLLHHQASQHRQLSGQKVE